MMQNHDQERKGNYGLFIAMVSVSMVIMYFLTYLNSYDILDHARFSETRLFMTLIMGSVMSVVMLLFMRRMYQNKAANIGILVGAALLFGSALFLVRSQATVIDVDYLRGMIPHHSIAILTSERAQIRDLRVETLADEIILAQRREIREMDWLIEDIRTNGTATTEAEAEARSVPDFSETAD
jgi:FlaA1/EpsC-like NDP-sugar epimerase